MKIVTVRNTKIGSGMPKICVPITGRTSEEIAKQTLDAVEQLPDLVEWRADFFENLFEMNKVREVARKLREILGEIPLIFTIRTKNEGGNCDIIPERYQNLLLEVAKIEEIDLIDVEFFMNESMKALIKELQKMGKFVIASNHHFHETPSRDRMELILAEMELAGADLRKLAVMPFSREDVLSLLWVTVLANSTGEHPVITMSMGSLGAISRVAGEVFGSCVTFGTVGTGSAPGQLEISDLKRFLKNLKL